MEPISTHRDPSWPVVRPLTLSLIDEASPPRHYHLTLTQLYEMSFGFTSISKVCPVCLRVWAILRHDGDKAAFPTAVSCEHCDVTFPGSEVPGSLLRNWGSCESDQELLSKLPEELLIREFHLQLKAIEND